MSALLHAAEAALTQLRHLHEEAIKAATEKHAAETRSGVVLYGCPGPQHCPTAAAILDLEAEIAAARLNPNFARAFTQQPQPHLKGGGGARESRPANAESARNLLQ